MRMRWVMRMIIGGLLAFTIALAVFGQAVHYLWNWLMPALFHLPPITFWQSVGLLALSWVLFGGWRGYRGPRGGRRMMGRWKQMTPEERAKFREFIESRCGSFGTEAESKPGAAT
ncbi:MAG TPA: hypothetical protein VKB77_13215 [Terriglobales bacterium]|nr:hypothetical protein [Terriglobales bacterium]